MSDEITLHPICNLFPPMSEEEFAELKESIRADGVKTYITLWRGQLIDGRNRLRAMNELGIDHWEHTGELPNDEDPIAWAIAHNLHRRHLTPSQKALVASRLANMTEGRPSKETPAIEGVLVSQAEAAAIVGVSVAGVERARALERTAAPEVVEAVHAGTVTLNAATELAKAEPDKAKQAAIIAGGKQAVKKVIAEKKAEKPPEAKPVEVLPASRIATNTGAISGIIQAFDLAGQNEIKKRQVNTLIAILRDWGEQGRRIVHKIAQAYVDGGDATSEAVDIWLNDNE